MSLPYDLNRSTKNYDGITKAIKKVIAAATAAIGIHYHAIVGYAESKSIDLIVIGTRGRTGFKKNAARKCSI